MADSTFKQATMLAHTSKSVTIQTPYHTAIGHIEDALEPLQNDQHKLSLLTRCVYGMQEMVEQSGSQQAYDALMARSNPEVVIRALSAWLESGPRLKDEPRLEDALVLLRKAVVAEVGVEPVVPDSAAPQAAGAVKDGLERLRQKGVKRRQVVLSQEGGTLSSLEVSERLDISRQAVNLRRKQNVLLAVKDGSRYRYPVWQFNDTGALVEGIEEVLKVLRGTSPIMQIQFFLNAHPALAAQRPLDLLKTGDLDSVMQVAATFGHHSAS